MKKKKTVKSKYTDIPVQDISNGMILLDNKLKVSAKELLEE